MTLPGLKIDKITNISSEELNAILVWIPSENENCSPKEEPKFKAKKNNISFDEVNDNPLEAQRLIDDPILIIIIFYNEDLKETDISYFKEVIETSSDSIDAISTVRKANLCGQKAIPFKPREQDGDVIGGNG